MKISGRVQDLSVDESGTVDPKAFVWCYDNVNNTTAPGAVFVDKEAATDFPDGIVVKREDEGLYVELPANYQDTLLWDDLDIDKTIEIGELEPAARVRIVS